MEYAGFCPSISAWFGFGSEDICFGQAFCNSKTYEGKVVKHHSLL